VHWLIPCLVGGGRNVNRQSEVFVVGETRLSEAAREVVASVCASDALPTVPAVALQIMVTCRDPNVDFKGLASLVSADPALTARMLRMANTSAFRGRRKVSSIRNALGRLGLRQTRALVLGFALASELERKIIPGFDTRHFWRYALTTSHAARLTAELIRPQYTDTAFAGGLLQDVGVLAFQCALPEQYCNVLAEQAESPGRELHEIESRVLGATHMDVGARLLHRWGLPSEVYEPILHHHDADCAMSTDPNVKEQEVASILGIADIAARIFNGPDKNITHARFFHVVERQFGLSERAARGILERVGTAVRETASVFNLDPEGTPSYGEIQAKAARQMANLVVDMEAGFREFRVRARTATEQLREVKAHNVELTERATHDHLTGVLSRGGFIDRLKTALEQCRQEDTEIALIFLDIDHFKSVNDELGHPRGDAVLKLLSRQVVESVRQDDLVGRYGGDEFAVLLRDSDLQSVLEVADRLRHNVARASRSWFDDLRGITVSVGVAHAHPFVGDVSLDLLFSEADKTLYAAKAEGRNCTRHVSL